jgi:16S rRNA (adenine1518-N6/adenine1519-N6)-dimethyltransferase
MASVKAKKHLGQHFLTDLNIAGKIVESLSPGTRNVLEIGPGTGVLTQFMLDMEELNLVAIDVDHESVDYLKQHFPDHADRFIYGDFLKADIKKYFSNEPFSVIGNFPYNISTQILFVVLDHRDLIPEVVGMFQKEVAERIAAPPGSKTYGIMSVLLQAFYSIDYLFTVHEHVFNPPPKVKSAVIRLTRNKVQKLDCDEVVFKQLVKAAFNQRRKMLRNSIKAFIPSDDFAHPFLDRRPEQLSVAEFVELTNAVMNRGIPHNK